MWEWVYGVVSRLILAYAEPGRPGWLVLLQGWAGSLDLGAPAQPEGDSGSRRGRLNWL